MGGPQGRPRIVRVSLPLAAAASAAARDSLWRRRCRKDGGQPGGGRARRRRRSGDGAGAHGALERARTHTHKHTPGASAAARRRPSCPMTGRRRPAPGAPDRGSGDQNRETIHMQSYYPTIMTTNTSPSWISAGRGRGAGRRWARLAARHSPSTGPAGPAGPQVPGPRASIVGGVLVAGVWTGVTRALRDHLLALCCWCCWCWG